MDLIDFVMFVQGMIMMLLFGLLMMERILKFHYGDRRKRAFFIDLRISKWITLDKARKRFTFRDLIFFWDQNYERNECCVYDTRCVSAMRIQITKKHFFGSPETIEREEEQVYPLSPEIAKHELYYWPESTEFKNNFNTKIIKDIILSTQKDTLMLIIIAIGVTAALVLWNHQQLSGMQNQLDAMGQYMVGINNNLTHVPVVVRNP